MASAAAVATTLSQSPQPYQEEDNVLLNTTGTITGAEDRLPDEPPVPLNDDDVDEDEDVARPARRKLIAQTSNGARDEDEDGDLEDDTRDADEDLFGSEPEDPLSKPRQLDDEDLDSGDDVGREDRLPDEDGFAAEDAQQLQEELMFMDVEFGRHPVPEPSDGELYLMKIPRFLSVAPHAFDVEKFQPPVTDHHSRDAPSNTFSAYNTALTTVRWRRSPSDPSQLQSNAHLVRWSDGTLTMQVANDPQTHFNVPGFALAPPQVNPRKPTPTSVQYDKRKGKRAYKVENDSFTYLAAPNERAQILRITNKFTTSLKVDPASNATSDALERLQAQLAAAAGAGMGDVEGAGIGVVHITEDPELAKKKAEQAEKEKLRAQKRRDAQEQRDRERGRAGRSAFARRGAGYGGGLTVGGLEDDEDLGAPGRGRQQGASKPRKKPRPNRRGEILTDDEEEYGRRTRTKEDEYDEEDDFVAPSDEEEEIGGESEDDIDEGIDLEAAKKAQRGPGGGRGVDTDADGDVDDATPAARKGTPPAATTQDEDGAGSPVGRSAKRRRIIDEDEDE